MFNFATIQQTFLFSSTSSRCLEDVFIVTIFRLLRRLSCNYVLKTSSRHLEDVLEENVCTKTNIYWVVNIIILNFQLVKSSWQLLKYQFSTHSFQKDFSTQKAHLVPDKILSLNLKLIKSKSELTKSNLQLIILFSICNADLQLVKLLSKS